MTRLDRLDGPATAAVSDRLVDVYRAAMGAAPFHETEVEAGFFAEELAGELEEPDPPASGPPVGEATSPAE